MFHILETIRNNKLIITKCKQTNKQKKIKTRNTNKQCVDQDSAKIAVAFDPLIAGLYFRAEN